MALNTPGIPDTFLMQLGIWAARALVLALFAGFALALFRVKSTGVRLLSWTAVLYAGLAIPLLSFLLPSLPLPVPARLRSGATTTTVDVVVVPARTRAILYPIRREPNSNERTVAPVIAQRSWLAASPRISWTMAAVTLYMAGAVFLLLRLAVGLMLSRRLVKLALPIDDPRVMSKMRVRNPRFKSQAYESERVSVPVTVGVIRSRIVLPPSWRVWDDEKLDAILAHEVSHIGRADALTQCVALIHRAIFWFSPFSWWLSTHLANLAEQASDEAALSSGADRNRYAKTLLSFLEALQAGPERVRWQGVSMAHARGAEKRVERILEWKGAFTMGLKRSAIVIIAACGVPALFVAASAKPFSAAPTPQASALHIPPPASAPDPQEAPAAAPALPAAPAPGVVAPAAPAQGVNRSGLPPVAPIGPAAPVGPVAPVAPASSWSDRGNRFSYAYGFDDEDRFVIVSGNTDSLTMSGSSQDARHVRKLRKQISGDFIWFQRDEKSYVIRDQATIDRARKLWAPQEELGKKQEELGKQQEALGKQQEELGKQMRQVKVNIPDMSAELDRLKAKLQKLGPNASIEQLGELQSEIGELQSKIGEIQSQAGTEQSKVASLQSALGAKQGELGARQGELGRQQGELARQASIQMKQILDEALKNGTAKPEPEMSDSSTL